eukprot:UN17048
MTEAQKNWVRSKRLINRVSLKNVIQLQKTNKTISSSYSNKSDFRFLY